MPAGAQRQPLNSSIQRTMVYMTMIESDKNVNNKGRQHLIFLGKVRCIRKNQITIIKVKNKVAEIKYCMMLREKQDLFLKERLLMEVSAWIQAFFMLFCKTKFHQLSIMEAVCLFHLQTTHFSCINS